MRFIKILILFALHIALLGYTQPNLKKINLGEFSVTIPRNWNQKRLGGVDSFVGEIVGPKVLLSFDYSDMGYANHLDEIDAKSHIIKTDSSGKYIIKIIYPKISGKGMTGVYIKHKSSNSNFQMNGENLSASNQKLALAAFETINFKQ